MSQSDFLLGTGLSFPRSSKLTLARERQRQRDRRKHCGFGSILTEQALSAGAVGSYRPKCKGSLEFANSKITRGMATCCERIIQCICGSAGRLTLVHERTVENKIKLLFRD